jgi:hypothetical protein
MILVNSLPRPTEIQDVNPCVLGEKIALYTSMQQKGLTLTVGPVALLWTAEKVRTLRADPDPDDAATEHARRTAEQLLTECTATTASAISPISIDQFEHDLFLRWEANGKGLILTCPATNNRGPSLYRERIENGRAKSTEMLANASASDLAQSMQWMLEA